MTDYKKYVRALLGNKQLNFHEILNRIKLNIPYKYYSEAIKMHPTLHRFFNEKIHFKDPEGIVQREPLHYSENFTIEYKWKILLIEENFSLINDFIKLKREFEKAILSAKYNEAKNYLLNIEQQFGVTLWTLESNLIIEELVNGSEANWNKLSQYLKKIRSAFYEFVTSTASKRVESNLSFEAFLNQFQNDLDNTNASNIVKDFFVFKHLPSVNYDYESKELASVLYVSGIFGIIDQYLILIDVMCYNSVNAEFPSSIFYSFLKKARFEIPNDPVIRNLCDLILKQKNLSTADTPSELLQCISFYYKGNFEESYKIASEQIRLNTLEFEYYEIYCKSLINLNLPLNVDTHTIGNQIIHELYELLKFRETYEECIDKLLKLAITLSNFSFGKQLYLIIAEIEGSNNKYNKIGALYATYFSIKIFEKLPFTQDYIYRHKKDLDIYGYQIALFKSGNNINSEIQSLSAVQLKILKAQNYFNKADYQATINLLQDKTLNDVNYYLERKLSLLFDSYININDYEAALNIFIKVAFSKKIVSKKINYFRLYNSLKAEENRQNIKSISIPILFSFIVNEFDLYEVFDEFLELEGINSMADLNTNHLIERYSLDLYIYFLEHVCTIDTLKYSTEFTSVSEVEEERIRILKILIEINNSEKLKYDNEINDIYRVNSVRKVLREVDEGRLYIDVNALKNLQIKKFRDDYSRFKEIDTVAENQQLFGFNTSLIRSWDPSSITNEEKNEDYNSANYLAFKNIYLELRDNFLFSKEYGLDACLSTRIRHGALKNHIRSVFEKLNLVTSRTNSGYLDNPIWHQELQLFPDKNVKVQNRLKEFSSEIDRFTSYIVDKLLQIKTEKISDKPDALFQFMTHDDLLFNYYQKGKHSFDSVDTTVEILLTELVNHTLINLLGEISDTFTKGSISQTFQLIIDQLVKDLKDEELPHGCDLIPNVIKSTTDIQNELEYLSEWFYLNTTSPSTLLSMETILNASLNLTNRINPLFSLSPEINIKTDFAGYSNLIFVFNILLNNVIKHSNLENDDIVLYIEVDVDTSERMATVSFKNNLNPNFDYSSNFKKLESVKQNWNNHLNIERSNKEGESGFDKIKRILLYETFSKTNKFEFQMKEYSTSVTLFFPYSNSYVND